MLVVRTSIIGCQVLETETIFSFKIKIPSHHYGLVIKVEWHHIMTFLQILPVQLQGRRFTFFPPEQLENLYVGPIDFSPAGQPISLVDILNPDYAKFPKYKNAEDAALFADLEIVMQYLCQACGGIMLKRKTI